MLVPHNVLPGIWSGTTSPANNENKPGFAAALMLKDLRLAQEAALITGALTPLGAETAQLYGLLDELGQGGDDFSGVIHLLRGYQDRKGRLI